MAVHLGLGRIVTRVEKPYRVGLLGCLAAMAVVLLAGACSSQDTPSQYSDEELALSVLVDEQMLVVAAAAGLAAV